MPEQALFQVACVVVLGVGAQWLAARIGLPSILLLLTFGFIAGPVTGLLQFNPQFDEVLFPFVSLAVALILYEGGLTLKLAELRGAGRVVTYLCSIGALLTWAVSTAAAYLIFDELSLGVAALLGAILVVTGPTVIGPLLHHIRPTGPVGPILKWEGIAVDPLGATLAVLVFEVIASGRSPDVAAAHVALSLLRTIMIGGGLGVAAAYLLALLLQRYWIPDFLQNSVSLMFVIAAFAGANALQDESGLLTVTVMGFVLANQKLADVRHIVEFKENLRVLLISALFILLAARLDPANLKQVGVGGAVFVALLIFIGRPLAVWVATVRSGLAQRERHFLAWMAPRGIVAAAVSSLFALRLEDAGHSGAHLLVPIVFLVIIGTVGIYGLTAPLVARRLGVAVPNPQGVILVGAPAWTRALAVVLRDKGFPVLLVDNNRYHAAAARMEGLPTYSGSILADYAIDEINLGGIGRLLAVTPNDWVNALAVQRFTRILGSAHCYQLPPRADPQDKPATYKHLHGRWLFGEGVTYSELARRFGEGHTIKATRLSESFDYAAFTSRYGPTAVPMFVITESGRLSVITAGQPLLPVAGQTLISLVKDQPAPAAPPPADDA
ncbi:MAG: sodium:proton antiporter [Phycisphaerae bacterium]|nr:sodium:proton antiporter [Phycisphaerae bacterium]